MKFVVDESADARMVAFLAARGHDAFFIAARYGPGLSDEAILAVARDEGRVVITDDRDFAELVYRHGQRHSGVIYFRLKDTLWSTRQARLAYVLEHHAGLLDQFLVVTDSRVRSGPPPRA